MKKKIILLIPILLAACSDKGQEYREEANRAYEQIKTSNNPGSLFRVAESMRNTGNFDMAAKTYKQALQIDPTMTSAYIGLSQSLRFSGRPNSALQALNNMPQDSRDAAWYKELGAVHTASQKPKACVEAYSKAYETNPTDLGTLNGIAVCNDLMGKHLEAQKWYQQAMAVAPTDGNLKSNYGLSLALSSKPHEAIATLHEVVDNEGSTPRDRQNLAIAYGLAGDMDTAAKLFSQDLAQNEVRQNLAFVHKLAHTQHLVHVPTANPQPGQQTANRIKTAPLLPAAPQQTPAPTNKSGPEKAWFKETASQVAPVAPQQTPPAPTTNPGAQAAQLQQAATQQASVPTSNSSNERSWFTDTASQVAPAAPQQTPTAPTQNPGAEAAQLQQAATQQTPAPAENPDAEPSWYEEPTTWSEDPTAEYTTATVATTNQEQAPIQAAETVSTDSRLVVGPLPTKESYYDAPIPSIVQQVREETKGTSTALSATAEPANFSEEDSQEEAVSAAALQEEGDKKAKVGRGNQKGQSKKATPKAAKSKNASLKPVAAKTSKPKKPVMKQVAKKQETKKPKTNVKKDTKQQS